MTKPKEYPLNRRGWAIFEIRKQGGSWVRGLRPVIIVKESGMYKLKADDPSCFIGENVNPQTRRKLAFRECLSVNIGEEFYTSTTRKLLMKQGEPLPYFGTEGTKDKRELIGPYVCDLFHKLERVPTRAELKAYILQKEETPQQIHRDLSGPDSNSHMRRLMIQCMLEWLPTASRRRRIIELPPPYGCKYSFLYSLRHPYFSSGRCSLRLFFQLERGEEWPPPKKKRGRPRKEA